MSVSRVCSPEDIIFAIKPQEEGLDSWTSNVVFREVLLNPPVPLQQEDTATITQDTIAVELDALDPADLDYEGPHDELLPETSEDNDFGPDPCNPRRRQVQGGVASKSASPPRGVAPHPSLLEPLPPLPLRPQRQQETIDERNTREREEKWTSLQMEIDALMMELD